jgi:hypothetical protein
VYYDDVDLFDSSNHTLRVADKIGGYEVFGSVVIAGPHTQLLRDRVAVIKRRQSWQAHLGQSVQRRDLANVTSANKIMEPLVSVAELGHSVTIVSFVASDVESSYYLLRALLEPLHSGYFERASVSKIDGSFFLDAAPFSNRLPPTRGTLQSRYGRWYEQSVHKLLDEYDAGLACNS